MSKESFLLTLLIYHVNKSFIGVTGLFAFQFGFSERKAMLESQPDNND